MRPIALAAVLLTVTAPAVARDVTTARKPVTVVVTALAHEFKPPVITMPANRPVRLVLQNVSGNDHEFRADDFFAGAKIEDADARKVDVNRIVLPKQSSIAVRLIAPPGEYTVKSTVPMDAIANMHAKILAQ